MSIILSLDIGTSKICSLAYSQTEGKVLDVVAKINDSLVSLPDKRRHEQSVEIIKNTVFEALSELLTRGDVDAQAVSGIAVTGQMHGVLLVDDNCRPVTNLITWRDGRSAEVANTIGLKFADSNGCGLRAGYGGATLACLAKNGDIKSGYKAVSIADYICAILTGRIATEPIHAASWGIYDLKNGKWNQPMLDELCVPVEVLPEICQTSELLGETLSGIASDLGLGKAVKIYSPVGDNQASVIGARGKHCDAAVLNLGTGGQITLPCDKLEYFEGFEVRPMPDNSYILVGASLCGGWAYAYLKDFFKTVVSEFADVELDDITIYAKMNSYLESSFESGLNVDPRFNGTRDDANVCGSINLINTHNLNSAEMTRAFATSMIAELSEMIPEKHFGQFSKVIASGNAVRKNPAILSVIQEHFGKPVETTHFNEEAALGAALTC